MENVKIRINLSSQELEIEGSEKFVASYAKKVDELLERLATLPSKGSSATLTGAGSSNRTISGNLSGMDVPETFGEFYHLFPRTASDKDKMLIAGYYAQSTKGGDNSFETKDASALLLEQGIRLSNPSHFLRQSISSKHLIMLSKGKFRVSMDGIEYLNNLMTGGE